MKKLIMLAALLACASIVPAQVVSDNIVGYTTVTKPANGELNMVGVSFLSTGQTLNELFPADQFEGELFNAGASDQIIAWNAVSQSYATYVFYDVSGTYGPAYATYDGWQEFGQFGSANYANPVIPAGSAFWFRGSGGSAGDLLAQGEVKQEVIASQSVVVGLQQLANPFASDNTIGALFGDSPSGQMYNPAGSDQIHVWDAGLQAYTSYVYYEPSRYYPWYYYYDGWQEYSQFGTDNYADDTVIPVGQGFWYIATREFNWTPAKNY